MSADTVTNFLEPSKDILADIKSRVGALDDINFVYITAGNQYKDLFKETSLAQPPFACIAYENSSYGQNPRRTYKFSVIIASRFMVNDETAQNNTFDLMDSVVGAIDHNVFNEQCIYKVTGDSYLSYPYSGLNVYKLDFIAEDY